MPKPLRVRELVQKMKAFGVIAKPGRGSEIKLMRPGRPMHTIRAHGQGDEVGRTVIRVACQKLGIDPDEFWETSD
jgi:hypothetical protein